MPATVMTFANFKGGVGKTSTTALVSYNLSKLGYKCLVIDFDAQANITSLLLKTKSNESDIITINTTLMAAINEQKELNEIIINIKPNLDLIPNAVDFSIYPRYLEKNFENEIDKVAFFSNKMDSLRAEYDFIFIDVPPTLSLLNDTAFYACNQIIVVLQTQERSLAGAEVFIQYLQDTLINEFNSNVDILGILPVLSKKGARVDQEILKAAIQEFGSDNIFNNKISIMERIKRMDMQGITDNQKDIHDRNVNKVFTDVAEEILKRLSSVKKEEV
ncbi:AAA family ATPase [Listeria innocua]|uniref:ParA family protein n=1 Tax=Listeria innocua TaxID=1642 RepID=UPI001627719F|nr:AAA family ATPase [Listeria innocua]MBC2137506.1 AAA family ATPase [Listeria innocua]